MQDHLEIQERRDRHLRLLLEALQGVEVEYPTPEAALMAAADSPATMVAEVLTAAPP
jgi:hypothetical protein